MEIYIFSNRFNEYGKLFSVFNGSDLRFSRTEDPGILSARSGYPIPRVVVADPRMMEVCAEDALPPAGMEDPDVRIVIGSPVSGSGLALELRRELESRGIYVSAFAQDEYVGESAVRYRPMSSERRLHGRMTERNSRERPERKVIALAGMTPGAGCTLLSLLLAEELASAQMPDNPLITVFSPEDASIYNSLGMKNRFRDRNFTDIADLKEEGVIGVFNVDEGISWAVSSPESEARFLLPGEKAGLARRLDGDFLLWDMGSRELAPTLRQAGDSLDALILVVDPLPSALLTGYLNLEAAQNSACPVIYLLNKWNTGVDQASVLDFLGVEEPVLMPLLDTALIYRSEFACENPYREREIRESAADTLRELMNRLHLPDGGRTGSGSL